MKYLENNPDDDWINDDEIPETDINEKYERFYIKWKKRIMGGENPETASIDAPIGFTEWLKSNKRTIK